MNHEGMIHGIWQVAGQRIYRGHHPGTEFEESLDAHAAGVAISRGHLRLVETLVPELPADRQLPEGWV